MRITAEQMERIAHARFRDRLITLLSQVDPDAAALYEPAGRQLLDRWIERARGHGLASELDIGRFVASAWLLGEDFDSRIPAMREILVEPRLSPAQKAEALETLTTSWLNQLHQGRLD